MDQNYLIVARILSPQGNRGELKAQVITDFPERFDSIRLVYVGAEHHPYEVEGHRLLKGTVILKLKGVDTIGDAETLRGELVEVPAAEAVKLPPGHYFWHQLLGLRVETVAGEVLGQLDDILETGSNDVYVVKGAAGEILIPAIRQVVKSVDLAGGVITVELMPWLD